jgi:SAM-dependent methyltransferase
MSTPKPPDHKPAEIDSGRKLQAMYEALPYPARNPEDEKVRLVRTGLDFLPKISHYCHAGRLDLRESFRVLVAGGGTGDSLIYLAEQLRNRPAELVYVDFSQTSMDIARRRAEIRGLNNIRFHLASILEIERLGLKPFDYINCSGVLHHLPDPLLGLVKLRDLLSPRGVLGLMVYAKYGRTAVYQVQELMRRLAGEADQPTRIALTWKMLEALPESHWFKRSPELHTDHERHGDAGLADLFLNPIDQAYSIPELYAWLDSAELTLIEFADHKLAYDPALYVSDPALLAAISEKPPVEQQAIAELISGTIIKHTFYAARQARQPAKLNDQTIPIVAFELNLEQLVRDLNSQPPGATHLIEKPGARINLPVNPISTGFFQNMGQGKTFAELVSIVSQAAALRAAPPGWVRDQLVALCELLVRAEFVYFNEIADQD